MKQALIEAKDFNRMIKNLKKVLRPRGTNTPEHGRNNLVELIHLEVKEYQIKCVASDGYRLHEEYLSAETEEEFVCHITPPRLTAANTVRIFLEDSTAFVEFDDVRFATRQPSQPLTVLDSNHIKKMIGDDERFEVAVNPKYLLDALNAMKGEKQIILNVGNPMLPITLYPSNSLGKRTYSILPVRRTCFGDTGGWRTTASERMKVEQDKQLRYLRNRLTNILTLSQANGEEQGNPIWEEAGYLKAALDEFLKEDDRT